MFILPEVNDYLITKDGNMFTIEEIKFVKLEDRTYLVKAKNGEWYLNKDVEFADRDIWEAEAKINAVMKLFNYHFKDMLDKDSYENNIEREEELEARLKHGDSLTNDENDWILFMPHIFTTIRALGAKDAPFAMWAIDQIANTLELNEHSESVDLLRKEIEKILGGAMYHLQNYIKRMTL